MEKRFLKKHLQNITAFALSIYSYTPVDHNNAKTKRTLLPVKQELEKSHTCS